MFIGVRFTSRTPTVKNQTPTNIVSARVEQLRLSVFVLETLFKLKKRDIPTGVGLADILKQPSRKMYQSMTITGKELGNSVPIKSNCLSAHANYAWLKGKGLDASIFPASRCPSSEPTSLKPRNPALLVEDFEQDVQHLRDRGWL